eukprot:TRINITY_DN6173_c0_g1_i1.p1 TRINITY_DN6173_c0_g1~~TRINITY_DN6173_c0_g1_i1.p1  ORF type:complete len:388 (+),score=63.14 TRINITY_DN6173_c0_g1_i1:42-1205(+)
MNPILISGLVGVAAILIIVDVIDTIPFLFGFLSAFVNFYLLTQSELLPRSVTQLIFAEISPKSSPVILVEDESQQVNQKSSPRKKFTQKNREPQILLPETESGQVPSEMVESSMAPPGMLSSHRTNSLNSKLESKSEPATPNSLRSGNSLRSFISPFFSGYHRHSSNANMTEVTSEEGSPQFEYTLSPRDIVEEGWMETRFPGMSLIKSSWYRRYCSLSRKGFLSYSHDGDKDNIEGFIVLSGCELRERSSSSGTSRIEIFHKEKKCIFRRATDRAGSSNNNNNFSTSNLMNVGPHPTSAPDSSLMSFRWWGDRCDLRSESELELKRWQEGLCTVLGAILINSGGERSRNDNTNSKNNTAIQQSSSLQYKQRSNSIYDESSVPEPSS